MQVVNPKKSISVKNRTNYFNPTTTKTKNTFSSPASYHNREQKIEGYETRLYWQYRYCNEHNGQTFFYTLTYNDAALPFEYGMNCFDYEDLRDLLTGGFRKQLLRKYGTTFKYFISAELGDGKGSRGLHNNPHYHCLFFLEDAHNPRFPYVKISPDDFRHLIRLYWQGFDEDEDGFRDYNTAKYGIIKEGDDTGLVGNFHAEKYCAKYVCKDAKLVQNEHKVIKNAKLYFKRIYRPYEDENGIVSYHYANEVARHYFDDVIRPMYNFYLVKRGYSLTRLMEHLGIELPFSLVGFSIIPNAARWYDLVEIMCKKLGMWQDFCDYRRCYIEPLIKEKVNEWRNRFSNKVRISHGVGDYALKTIDPMSPSILFPSKKGFKNRPIGMYYYRKLYCDVVKDPKGQNLYILNETGIQYKLANLPKRIKKVSVKAMNNLELVYTRPDLYEKMRESDVNTKVFMRFPEFSRSMDYLLNENNLKEIIKRYAEYKLVYEDRFFSYRFNGSSNLADFPDLDLFNDYRRFLTPAFYSVDYDPDALTNFMENPVEGYLPYSMHPYFLRYIGIFDILDMCADYLFVQKDDKKQKEAEERALTKRFHDRQKLIDFYSRFSN